MPAKPVPISAMPIKTTGREPRSSANLPNVSAPTAQPSIATMYGNVTIERVTPNSFSIGGRNKLKVLMPMEVMVATAVQRNRIE